MTHPNALPLGTRVRLSSGRVGTLISCNYTRAVVQLDKGEVPAREFATADGDVVTIEGRRRVDISPTSEIEVVG